VVIQRIIFLLALIYFYHAMLNSVIAMNLLGSIVFSDLRGVPQNEFSSVGVNAEGPKIGGGLVSYSFQEAPTTVSNHRQIDVPTLSIQDLEPCAKEQIRQVFDDWSNVANISFEELSDKRR